MFWDAVQPVPARGFVACSAIFLVNEGGNIWGVVYNVFREHSCWMRIVSLCCLPQWFRYVCWLMLFMSSRRNAAANRGRNAVGVDTPTANVVVSRLLSLLGFFGHSSVMEKFADLPDSVKNSANRQTSDGNEVKGVFHGGAGGVFSVQYDSIKVVGGALVCIGMQ